MLLHAQSTMSITFIYTLVLGKRIIHHGVVRISSLPPVTITKVN